MEILKHIGRSVLLDPSKLTMRLFVPGLFIYVAIKEGTSSNAPLGTWIVMAGMVMLLFAMSFVTPGKVGADDLLGGGDD